MTCREGESADSGSSALLDVPVSLVRFVPTHEVLLLALDETDPQRLTGSALAQALRVLQVETAPMGEFEEVLGQAISDLQSLSPHQEAEWRRAMWFLCQLIRHRRELDEQEPLFDLVMTAARAHRKEVAEMKMTGAEADVARGLKEGLEKGREEERLRMVILIIENRFGPLSLDLLARLEAAPKADLTRLAQRALNAASIEELQAAL